MDWGILLQLVIGVLGIMVALAIYLWQRKRKDLSCAMMTNRSILAVDSPFAITVQHDGTAVSKPRLVVLRIANTGNVAIRAADFERKITMSFPSCELLSAEVSGTYPAALSPVVHVEDSAVVIEPCLLNPSDVIEIQSLLDGNLDTEPTVECRIVGVSSVRTVKLARDSWGKVWRFTSGALFVTILADLALAGLGASMIIGESWLSIGMGISLVIVALTSFLAGVRNFRKSRLWLILPSRHE